LAQHQRLIPNRHLNQSENAILPATGSTIITVNYVRLALQFGT